MIQINTLKSTRGNNGSGGSGSGGGGTANINLIKTGVQGVYLWGRWHDHEHDITGDLDYVGNINATGDITTDGDITTTMGNVSGVKGTFEEIDVPVGNFKELHTDNIYNTGTIKTYNMSAVTAYIKSLMSGDLVCDNLTVTKAAHFFKLIIDEIKSSQGMFILSPGNTDLDHVGHPEDNIYRCFFRAKDEDTGEAIYNMFEPYDQVVCQTFNAATGTTYNVSNKWYWMLAVNTGTTTTVPFVSDSIYQTLLDTFDEDEDGLLSLDEFNEIDDIGTMFASSAITGNFPEMAYMGSVTALNASAFTNSRITGINVSESVKTIGNSAFENCSELTNITLPTDLTSIGDRVFRNCQYLSELIILRGTIGSNCFSGCTNLTYLQLPEGMTEINDLTLAGCDSIQTLVIPSTVSAITENAFDHLFDLRRVYMRPDTPPVVSGETGYLFDKCSSLAAIYVPSDSFDDYEQGFLYPTGTLYRYTYDEIGTGEQAEAVTMDYHYVDLDTNDKDEYSNSVPERGDSIAVLGNRYDTERQNALMLGAYNIAWLDSEIKAPFMTQYAGIDDYDLKSHRLNVISNGRNEFFGHFKVIVSGGTYTDLDDYISENSGMELVVDSDSVYFMTDRDGYITSLKSVKGLPTVIYVKMGTKRIPILEWDNNSYIKFNGNNNDPLRSGKEE